MPCASQGDETLVQIKSVRLKMMSMAMAMVAAGIISTLIYGRHPVASVTAIRGSASSNGQSRPVTAGSVLEAGEVIVTGAHSTVLVGMADDSKVWTIFESQVTFGGNGWWWFDQADRWLSGIKTNIQRLGGPPPSDRLTYPKRRNGGTSRHRNLDG